MSDHPVEVRIPLAVSPRARVDLDQDGVLHVLAGAITLHLDRASCEELTTTLARAMVRLAKSQPNPPRRKLSLVPTSQPITNDNEPALVQQENRT
jgi:hypothetical protein